MVAVTTPADNASVYVNLGSSFSGVLFSGFDEICATCGFDQGTCQPLLPGRARPPVTGPLYGRMTLYRNIDYPSDVVAGDIDIWWLVKGIVHCAEEMASSSTSVVGCGRGLWGTAGARGG